MKMNTQSSESIAKEIQELKDKINNHKISLKEEKDIVARISALEQILPHAFTHDEIQKVL